MKHELTECKKEFATMHYHNKSYSASFACPSCGRSGRYNLNFLGRRIVICNGEVFAKVAK